jgi:hypothetical protein
MKFFFSRLQLASFLLKVEKPVQQDVEKPVQQDNEEFGNF